MAEFQVAVVGAGPIGLTLANLLGQLGVRTVVIERNSFTVTEPRAVSIDDESLRTMQAVGLVEEVMQHIVPGYGSHYLSPTGRCFLRVEPTGKPYGFPRRNAFRQPVLEAQLRGGLARFGHLDMRFDTALERFSQDHNEVTLHLRDAQGQSQVLTCNFLVGCDGAASLVREHIGGALGGTTFDERWLILDLENNENTAHHTEVFCNPARPCITLPGPDNTRRYEFKLLDGETDADMLAPDKVGELMRTHGASPHATLRRKVVYRFHARVADRWRDGRVFLAGDAAHLTPPFAGQGMNSGLRDAQNLAWKLAFVLRGQLSPSLLDSYEIERRDHVWQMIRLALRMGQVMAPRNALDGWLKRSLFDLLTIWPRARDYFSQMKYKPPPRFHDGWLVEDGRGRASLVGRMLPQPRIDGQLLDDLIGPNFALISCDARLDRLTSPFWDQIGAARLTLPELAGVPQGHVLLLRPDRYVAAVFEAADEAKIVTALSF